MLTLDQLNFLLELCQVNGLSVPITRARLAAETYETLQQMKIDEEAKNAPAPAA